MLSMNRFYCSIFNINNMELRKAKRKRFSAPSNEQLLPINGNEIFTGYLTGTFVTVKNSKEMLSIYKMGYFGKGSFSRGGPQVEGANNLNHPILEQQRLNRLKGGYEVSDTVIEERKILEVAESSLKKLLSAPFVDAQDLWKNFKSHLDDSTNNTSHYPVDSQTFLLTTEANNEKCENLVNSVDEILKSGVLRTRKRISSNEEAAETENSDFESNAPGPKENLHLSLCESFFLSWALGKLRVCDSTHSQMSSKSLWEIFQMLETGFVCRYVAYHWYRSRGWIVRSGLKYGGDFVLYEKGPNYCHSTYVVVVRESSSRQWKWCELALYQRLAETCNKDVIFCHVIPPADYDGTACADPAVISRFQVCEILCRRWIASQQRVMK